jgi:membrane protein DedA with SNARE-associated domain
MEEMSASLVNWLTNHGTLALFGYLALGIIALPFPQETLVILAGILMHNGTLNPSSTIIAAFSGCICGISFSYVLGRSIGKHFLIRFGKWLGLTEANLTHAQRWFNKLGVWALFFGYFIPGVRHFIALLAGMLYLKYQKFALFAYCGVILWVALFLSLGYFFGNYWNDIFEDIESKSGLIILITVAVCATYLLVKALIRNKK